jgi:hypothetical protein
MDEKLFYTIFTIVYSTISARECNLIIISVGGDIEAIGTSAYSVERGFEDLVVGHADDLTLYCAEIG